MARNNRVTFENARITFRNFSGKEGQYNAEGQRNFLLLLEPEIADQMAKDGWNIGTLKPRNDEEDPQPFVQVSVSYRGAYPPRVVLITGRGRTDLGEEEVNVLDFAEIRNVDLIINPSHWKVNGKEGIKAYLHAIYVTIEEDELEKKYADVPDSARTVIPESINPPPWED